MSGPVLEINPETELKFTLSHNEATPRCILTLTHPGTTDEHMAFKVCPSFSYVELVESVRRFGENAKI
jgi:hypothetical protein